jgi:hypothetical protein
VTLIDPRTVNVMKVIGLALLYSWFFWSTFKNNRGNRLIQCGSITLILLMVIVVLIRIPKVPFTYIEWLGVALLLFCLLTLFFLFQQGYHALRNRKDKS